MYSLVRFVPDPARGEFVNLGAIAGSEESAEWQYRQVENFSRASRIDDHKSLEAVWAFLSRVDRAIEDFERSQQSLFEPEVEPSEAWLQQLYVDHRNVVQLSPPTPMVANSADEALDRVFDQLVLNPAARRRPFQTKHVAVGALRRAYDRHSVKIGLHLRQRVILETERYRERVDFAVTNGRALQLAHAWSFQAPDQEGLSEQVKAWGWTVRDLQDGGGAVSVVDGIRFTVPKDVDVEVVYLAPAADQESPAMSDALNVFEALKIRHGPLETADRVGQRARRLLAEAGAGPLELGQQ